MTGRQNICEDFDVAVIGAGVAGISAGYYLARASLKVAIIDRLAPMSFTSAQSGENYRNWWPHPTMTDFTNHSISLMEELSNLTDNCMAMTRKGYLLATRQQDHNTLIEQLYAGYGVGGVEQIRFHESGANNSYKQSLTGDWQQAPDGVDVVQDGAMIRDIYPHLAPDVTQLIHIRRAGEISFYPLGQYMLSCIRACGGQLIQASVTHIEQNGDAGFCVNFNDGESNRELHAAKLVNAAGPFAGQIAQMLGEDLPVQNFLQQKIAFEDTYGAIPRGAPFTVDLDDCTLDWDAEDRVLLAEDPEASWLTEGINGGIHSRPEGGEQGKWVKLGWAFNQQISEPSWQPEFDDIFPDLLIRGASKLNPALKAYIGRFPRNFRHYGGYYTMTEENWPLIGPMGCKNAYVIGGLSGFGTMAACGAGNLITSYIMDDALPSFANNLSFKRYDDADLMKDLSVLSTGAL